MRPLIVRLCNWVGEVVLSVPAMTRLERQGYALHLVGKGWAGPLLSGHSWTFHERPSQHQAAVAQLKALRRELALQDPSFDRRINTVLFTNSLSSAFEARRAGLKACGFRKEGRSLLLAQAVPMPKREHALADYWSLASALLGRDEPAPAEVDLHCSPAARQRAREVLAGHGVHWEEDGGRYAVLCPFAGTTFKAQSKIWPGFVELAKLLHEQGWPVVICPGPEEEELAERQFPQCIRLPRIGLAAYAAVQRGARFVVANDTGPGHVAAAVGAHTFSLFGPTVVSEWRPMGPKVHILQQPSGWPSVAQVMQQLPLAGP